MKVELKCLKCGSNEFANAKNVLFKDGQNVQCLKCGAVYPFEELKRVAVENAIEQYVKSNKQQILKNAETVTDEKQLKALGKLTAKK